MNRGIRRSIKIKPRFDEIDMLGMAHNSVYFKWFELGRLSLLQEIMSMEKALDLGVHMPVVENRCVYKRPVRFLDELVLVTTMPWNGKYQGKFVFEHVLSDSNTKEVKAQGETTVTVYSAREERLVRKLPKDVVEKIDYLARGMT
ncbi:MAG: acyl-CoA thioesterase [Deltaproteobacteria bacterium]|nr:acyl-CoA thioesterase [Deltaproteobacteria bacterium]